MRSTTDDRAAGGRLRPTGIARRSRSDRHREALPSIAVVIPCHGDTTSLELVLLGLRNQTVPPDEVICVDDHSTAREAARIARLARAAGGSFLELPRRRNHRGRRSAARNAGTDAARSTVVLYLDSDMVPGPEYVESLKWIHSLHRGALVKGARVNLSLSEVPPFLDGRPLPAATLGWWRPADPAAIPWPKNEALDRFLRGRFTIDPAMPAWTRCASNNLSVRRRWVRVVGGWDEGYVGWGEEDMDFSYRLYRMGLEPVVLLQGPLSAMHIGHGVDEEAKRQALHRNASLLLAKFPEILPWRLPAYRHHELPGYEEDVTTVAPGPCP